MDVNWLELSNLKKYLFWPNDLPKTPDNSLSRRFLNYSLISSSNWPTFAWTNVLTIVCLMCLPLELQWVRESGLPWGCCTFLSSPRTLLLPWEMLLSITVCSTQEFRRLATSGNTATKLTYNEVGSIGPGTHQLPFSTEKVFCPILQ